jgi:gliding motility-associated protein GldM
MAGAKETPRQKMIGMMYLVLTALLALQVSSAIIDKFDFLNKTLEQSVQRATTENNTTLEAIKGGAKTQKNAALIGKANEVQAKTAEVVTYLEGLKKELIEKTGGTKVDEGATLYVNPNGEADVESVMIGGNKNGKGYDLKAKLNDYTSYLNGLGDQLTKVDNRISFKFDPLALEPKEMPSVKDNPVQNIKDFAEFNFGQTPMVAALATISQKQSEVKRYEAAVLKSINDVIGGQVIVADKFVAMASPSAKTVAEGADYEAQMFVASFSSAITPTMVANGSPVPVEQGMGKVKFRATGGGYDKNGQVKKTWTGTIRVPKPGGGDTTFTFTEEYTVVKPVIKVESKALKALYLRCANDLIVSVPALGASYKPSFSGSGGAIIPGQNGEVRIVPTGTQVELVVSNNGSRIGSETFSVKGIPTPTLRFLGGTGAELNDRDGVSPNQANRITVRAEPDENFKETNPLDARYKVTEFEVTLARGRNVIGSPKRITGTDNASIADLMAQAKPGDRIRIDVRQVSRMNYKGEIEPVKMKGSTIRNIPLN